MIVCWRTVQVPKVERDRFMAWIEENRRRREEHGILFELVLGRSARQNPAKTLQPSSIRLPVGCKYSDRFVTCGNAWKGALPAGGYPTVVGWPRDRSEAVPLVRTGAG